MLADPLFWDRVAAATGAISSTATVGSQGGATTVVVDQEQEVVGVPSFAKKFVGDSTRAVATQVWRGTDASYVVETPGKPTSISGTASVLENGTGSIAKQIEDVNRQVQRQVSRPAGWRRLPAVRRGGRW